jgi:hypothetical protein
MKMKMKFTNVLWKGFFFVLLVCPFVVVAGALGDSSSAPTKSWHFAGHDLHNTRSAPAEHILRLGNVAGLAPRWVHDPRQRLWRVASGSGGGLSV